MIFGRCLKFFFGGVVGSNTIIQVLGRGEWKCCFFFEGVILSLGCVGVGERCNPSLFLLAW